jgi:serine/threonine protein kinase/tetratricopeptide (TPR) repeat protein
MPPGSSDRTTSRHAAGLLLRVQRPECPAEEFYLAPNLSIGRTPANAIVLAGDESVDRTHAHVEVAEDGTARLRCDAPNSTLTVGDATVRELILEPGVRFRIGRTEFECRSGRRRPEEAIQPDLSSCPYCGATEVSTIGPDARPCPTCAGLLIPIWTDPGVSDPIILPATYGTYRADRFVARGGMGLVLRATREAGTKPVALKILLSGTILDRRDTERFEHEIAMLARVRHANVVNLLDHGTAGRYPYLVLEWVEGPSLRQVIADAGRAARMMDFTVVLRWLEQVASGLAAIHTLGLVHRDLKPSNILIGQDGVARIADLGIAKPIDAGKMSYTTTGHAPGTFQYMAPEQFNAPDTVDGRTDLYALGMTFYELLTGIRPMGSWRPASQLNPSVPKVFDPIIEKLLAPRPSQRYSDVGALLAALSPFHPAPSPAASRPTPTANPGHGQDGQKPRPVVRQEPSSTQMDNLGQRIGSPRPLYSKVVEEAKLAAWYGAIWIGTFLAAVGGLFSILTACLFTLRSGELRIPWDIIHSMAPFALLGIIVGCLGAGVWGAIIALCGRDLGVIRVTNVDEAFTRILRAARMLVSELTYWGPEHKNIAIGVGRQVSRWWFVAACITALSLLGVIVWKATNTMLSTTYDARGASHYLNGEYDLAISDYTEAIRLDSKNAQALLFRGSAWYDKGDKDKALADFDEAIRLDPKLAGAFVGKGMVWYDKGDKDKALADFDEAIRLDPKFAGAFVGKGMVWYDKGDKDKALADFDEAIRLDPTDAGAFVSRGMVWYDKGDNEKALADHTEAIRLNPNNAEAYFYRGNIQYDKGDKDKALADYTEAIRLDPKSAAAYYNRALIWNAKQDHDKAVADLDEAIRLDPKFAEALEMREKLRAAKAKGQ